MNVTTVTAERKSGAIPREFSAEQEATQTLRALARAYCDGELGRHEYRRQRRQLIVELQAPVAAAADSTPETVAGTTPPAALDRRLRRWQLGVLGAIVLLLTLAITLSLKNMA